MQKVAQPINIVSNLPKNQVEHDTPATPSSSPAGVDVLGQFKANMQQVTQLQRRLNFMVREVEGLVRPRS